METFKKRQKEMKRLEKQRDKAARRAERKLNPLGSPIEAISDEEVGLTNEGAPEDAPEATNEQSQPHPGSNL